jgi:hypothetical protein
MVVLQRHLTLPLCVWHRRQLPLQAPQRAGWRVQVRKLLSPQMRPLRLPRPQLLHALLQALRAAPILLCIWRSTCSTRCRLDIMQRRRSPTSAAP